MDTSSWYRQFGSEEAAGSSPVYERLAITVADNEWVVEALETLPKWSRQPNLLFATVRFLGGPVDDERSFVDYVLDRWDEVRAVLCTRSTQTNEAARTGAFLPFLATLPQPLSLIEVGAAAGLCLYPDRYSICYDGTPPLVDSPVEVPVRTSGTIEAPMQLPVIASRTGIDLNPLDVTSAADVSWLLACIWPEHEARRQRLVAAAAIVAADPPRLVKGDLVAEIDGTIENAPTDTTVVVFHSAVLNYVSADARLEFADRLSRHRDVVWLSNEAPNVIATISTNLRPPAIASTATYFVVGRDGRTPLALSDPHGSWLAGPNDAGHHT